MTTELRLAAVIHCTMGVALIAGGLLLLSGVSDLARSWATALIMAPAVGVGMLLVTAASQEVQAARRR